MNAQHESFIIFLAENGIGPSIGNLCRSSIPSIYCKCTVSLTIKSFGDAADEQGLAVIT